VRGVQSYSDRARLIAAISLPDVRLRDARERNRININANCKTNTHEGGSTRSVAVGASHRRAGAERSERALSSFERS